MVSSIMGRCAELRNLIYDESDEGNIALRTIWVDGKRPRCRRAILSLSGCCWASRRKAPSLRAL